MAVRFEGDVQPLLGRCVACHGPGKARAGLRLDSREAATAELDSGNHAIVPGNPQQSELLRRVGAADPKKRMPPRGAALTAAQVEQLRRWIAAGADWPKHWAYRPLSKPPLPTVRTPNGARTPVDLFLLDKLSERGLGPPRPPTNAHSCGASSST